MYITVYYCTGHRGSAQSNRRHSVTPSVGSGDSSISTHSASLLGYSISAENDTRRDTGRMNIVLLICVICISLSFSSLPLSLPSLPSSLPPFSPLPAHRHSMFESSTNIPHQTSVYYNVSGEIVEVEGLKGKLGKKTNKCPQDVHTILCSTLCLASTVAVGCVCVSVCQVTFLASLYY